jgi:hypothetical protein
MKCLGMLRIKEVGLRTIVRYGAHDLEELKQLWGNFYLVPTTRTLRVTLEAPEGQYAKRPLCGPVGLNGATNSIEKH